MATVVRPPEAPVRLAPRPERAPAASLPACQRRDWWAFVMLIVCLLFMAFVNLYSLVAGWF